MEFSFSVNIEKRVPWTGKVFMVDRMTSDYAQAHPLDVDGFIESVYQKWADCETVGFRETREALRSQWIKTLSVTSPRGDASIYPNKNGEHHPALMEVWHKAGDYWRRGFRLGDVLPEIVPSHTITRLDGGWIALFPKDMGLLDAVEPAPVEEPVVEPAPVEVPVVEPSPVMSSEVETSNEIEVMPDAKISPQGRNDNEEPAPVIRHRRNRRSPAPSPQPDLFAHEHEISERNMKIFAAIATAVVFLLLLNTVGLFGIAALGLLAGSLVK